MSITKVVILEIAVMKTTSQQTNAVWYEYSCKCLFPFVRLRGFLYEPYHEMMALFVLRKLILQTRMRSHPVGLDVSFHTSCVRTAKALARLRGCAGSPELSLVAYVISTIISWVGSYVSEIIFINFTPLYIHVPEHGLDCFSFSNRHVVHSFRLLL